MTELQQTVSNWLKSAGSAAAVDLSLDEDGHCNVVFGNNLQCMVEVPEYGELFFLYAPLIQLPEDPQARSALLEKALELNLFSLATGGSSVSFDRRSDAVVLSFAQNIGAVDEQFFKDALGDFLDLAMDLHAKLHEEAPAPDAPQEQGGLAMLGMRV